jgi:hypothetical protein
VIAFVKARSRADLVAYGLVVLLIVSALAGPPIVGALDPRVPVTVAYDPIVIGHRDEFPQDPWGTRWPVADPPYSCGPNRIDEHGGGDDVFVLARGDWRIPFYRFGTEALFVVAVAAVVCWELTRVFLKMVGAPRGPLEVELFRGGLLAIGPTLALVVAILLGVQLTGTSEELAALGDGLFVPLKVALPASIYLAVLAALLAFRLRPPPE